MKKFIVIYHAPNDLMEKTKDTPPEERKESMKQWMVWAEKCGSGLVDMGSPLGNGKKVSQSGSKESTRNVVGYSVLQAESMEAAIEMLKEHPHLKWSGQCDIEIHECLPMPK